MGDMVYVSVTRHTLIQLKLSHRFTHSFNTMKEGDTSGIVNGVNGSLQYVAICSVVGSESRYVYQRI